MDALTPYWPIINAVLLLVVTIAGWSVRQALQQVDRLRESVDTMNALIPTINTNLAVLTSELKAHGALDMLRFAEIERRLMRIEGQKESRDG